MMINNSADIGELINKLETPLGRANAAAALSSEYQIPEEKVREAIATFEAVHDAEDAPEHNKNKEPLKTAATLARRIFWIEKAVDLTAKAGDTTGAAGIAEEFGLDKKAFELYKEEPRTAHKAIAIAEKLELWDEYVALCKSERRHADAINKCRKLGREGEAAAIFGEIFIAETKYAHGEGPERVAELAKKTDLVQYAMDLCKTHKKDYAMAVIAARTGQPALAVSFFKKTEHYAEAARQALLATKTDPTGRYVDEAIELFLKEVERLQKTYRYKESLEILKEIPITADSGDAVLNMIFDCYVHLRQFDEGAKYFEELKYCGVQQEIPRALALLEEAGKLGEARALAERHGLADKVKEYTQKLGWNGSLAKIAEIEGNFDQAIAHYAAEIEKEKARGQYCFAAESALRAAEQCRRHDKEELAAEFQENARGFFALAARHEEEQGNWGSAADFAKKAGDEEKAGLYLQINTIVRAYHTP